MRGLSVVDLVRRFWREKPSLDGLSFQLFDIDTGSVISDFNANLARLMLGAQLHQACLFLTALRPTLWCF